MSAIEPKKPARGDAREKLLQAAFTVFRTKGYADASVDELCSAAGVTKGAFFHHFKTKDDLAVAAAQFWAETTEPFFAAAPYHRHSDPLDRVLGYLDFRETILAGPVPEFTCLVGTLVQETYDTRPAIRDACDITISRHARVLEADIAAAIEKHGLSAPGVTAESLALHTQAVLQGAFILAKCRGGPEVAAESIRHLKRYIQMLFHPFGHLWSLATPKGKPMSEAELKEAAKAAMG